MSICLNSALFIVSHANVIIFLSYRVLLVYKRDFCYVTEQGFIFFKFSNFTVAAKWLML